MVGAATMTAVFALIVMGPRLAYVLVGLACLGAGMGAIYYAALYYAMAVGRARVEAGGTHEGLIGAGYALGPVIGLVGSAIQGYVGIVALVWTTVALTAVPAARPYVHARRGRRNR